MKPLLSAICLTVLFIGSVKGASYTTVRSGNVTDTSHTTGPWCATSSPCAVPGVGDTVVIANGHTLNLPAAASWTIGNSADLATYAIRTAGTGGTGILTTQPGSTLTLQGHVLQGNATWQIGTNAGGANVIFDHASTKLTWSISDAGSQASARLVITGKPGNRSTISKSSGGVVGGGFGPLSTQLDGGRLEATYANFTGIGDATTSAFRMRASSSAYTFQLSHVTLTSCGQWTPVSAVVNGASNILFEYVKVVTPAAQNNWWLYLTLAPRTTGTRIVRNISVTGGTIRCNPGGIGDTFDVSMSNIFVRNTSNIPPFHCVNAHLGSMTNVLHYTASSTSGGSAFNGVNVDGFYAIEDTPTNGNGHPIQGLAYTSTWQRWIVEGVNSQQQGDAIQVGQSGSIAGQKITIRDGLVVQPPGGYYGVIVNNSATNPHDATHLYPTMVSRNITWRGGSIGNTVGGSVQTGAAGGEGAGNQGRAGLYESVRNHIVWSEVPGAASYIVDYFGSSTGVAPPVDRTFTLADFNAYWNVVGGTGGFYKYSTTNPAVYETPPGANDVNVNPRFADTSRNLLAWGKSINPAHTTLANVLDEMAKLADDSGFDPRYSIENAIAWVRWGYMPQEPRLWATPDGSYYGGVDPTPLKVAAAAAAAF